MRSVFIVIAPLHRVPSFFFFKQKTAYEMVSGDWSSDVCSSDLRLCGDPPPSTRSRITAKPCGPPCAVRSTRSEERRVGQECRLTCRSRGSPYHSKKTKRHRISLAISTAETGTSLLQLRR